MNIRKKLLPFLYVGLLQFVLFFYFVFLLDPQEGFDIGNISFSPVIVFFALIFFMTSCIFTYIFSGKRRGFFAGVFITLIFILRFFGYREVLYVLILFLIFILVETLYQKER